MPDRIYKYFSVLAIIVALSACSEGSNDPAGSLNQAPVGSIDIPISDMTINVGDTLSFAATSSDPDGNLPLAYLWNFGAGSGIPDANIEDPGSVQFNIEGVFSVSFTVTDSLGLADPTPATRIITVNNQVPDGSIDTPSTDLKINVGDTLRFSATSSDPNGNLPLTYLWSFGAGSGIPDANIEDPGLVQFNNEGVFTVSFTVTNSLGIPDPTPAIRIITVGNQPPDGNIDLPATDLNINPGDTVSFTATSDDPDGDLPLTYLWNFGAGSGIPDAGTEDPGLVQFNSTGVFTVSFTVTDSLGLADPTPAIRIITVGNQPPDGSIDTPISDMTINVGDTLSFTATSDDPDGNLPLTYLWNFGDPGIPKANIEDPGSVQFNNEGVFTVSFTVTDSLGLDDPIPDLRIITVLPPPPHLIPQTGWSLLSVDSEELVAEDGAAVNAFDGDINTIWHTSWFTNPTAHPHNIDIYLGGSYQLSSFRYLPRQGSANGRINQYAFYVSTDGVNWGTPAASGNFANNATEQEALFAAAETGAFVRLVALSSFGDSWTTVAEITILGDLTTGNQAPDSIINTPGSDLIINVGDTLDFTGTGSDIEGNIPLTYLWNFGDPGIPDASIEDPGLVQFNNEGAFTVSFTVTDSLGLDDLTPEQRMITVCTPPSILLQEPDN